MGAPIIDHPKAKRERRLRKIDAALRARIEKAVEQLIETLDAMEDTDEDAAADDVPCDEDELESNLGWTTAANQDLALARTTSHWIEDMEDEHDGREPDNDEEPSLGSGHQPTSRHGLRAETGT